ncbi:MAG: malate/lactate/ureidoglycolate dehydrogenase [Alphaproteobacteria bacterium]
MARPIAVAPQPLRAVAAAVLQGAGCPPDEAKVVADHLVGANLAGHDSHGVIRLVTYVPWLADGMVRAGRKAKVTHETEVGAVVDGDRGLGQAIGEEAVRVGIDKARTRGIAVVAVRNTGHLGRIGHWAERAAEAGLVSMHYVNTTGFGMLVAPFGSTEARLSANPMAFGAPRRGAPPIILDISTAAIAEGKIKVARAAGKALPAGLVLDGDGRPTTDPAAFYGPPRGAILPFGGHKGHGLSVMIELLAGALTGGGTTDPGRDDARYLLNNMLSIYLAPDLLGTGDAYIAEAERLTAWVTGAPPAGTGDRVLMPGDVERETAARRSAEGIPLDANTAAELRRLAEGFGADPAALAG